MRIVNFGSLNIDHVYTVPHFVRPGETLPATSYRRFAGGKGCNQSIALAAAGAQVWHAGKIGPDGLWLKQKMEEYGVDTRFVEVTDCPTGHAVIQVAPDGENAIVIHGGANRLITQEDARRVLSFFGPGDCLLLQNEISSIPAILREAARIGMTKVFNPAPIDVAATHYPLDLVDTFVINELEGEELTGRKDPLAILDAMTERFPRAAVVLTLGEKGAMYRRAEETIVEPAVPVKAVDTTGAGDTFVGYFLADLALGKDPGAALRTACRAAAICVTRPGAADSIPRRMEVERTFGNETV
ncbi:MAG: ribokinase [Kiritimatiellae bacterium]|nr:ribokinase [Kiritimatiellia bacterium]